MPINFTQIFQDSWNFMRNQPKITIQFIMLFFISSLATSLLIPSGATPADLAVNEQTGANELQALIIQADTTNSVAMLIQVVFTMFLSVWGTVTIHQLSQRANPALSQTFTMALKRFSGVLLINILTTALIAIGLLKAFIAILTNTPPSIISLLSIVFGVFIFIRLCLATVHYVITPISLKNALAESWQAGIKRTFPLFIYCVIIYFALPLLIKNLAVISSNMIFDVLVMLLIAVFNMFSLIFTYRFYTLFMPKKMR